MSVFLAGLILLLTAAFSFAQSPAVEPAPVWRLPRQDNAALRVSALRKQQGDAPFEFAVALPAPIDPGLNGRWEPLEDGRQIWRQRIHSPGALSLNLAFSRFFLPEGAALTIFTADSSRHIGPFYGSDRNAKGQFWTPLIEADDIVLELVLPPGVEKDRLDVQIESVQHDFLGMTRILSEGCNIDVTCGRNDGFPEIEPFREVIQSVALYTVGGVSSCTGFLINNTLDDCRPYFMTAKHCRVDSANAPSMVLYWNYQNSACRAPGGITNAEPGDGGLQVFNSGAIYRAGLEQTDFVLVELDEPLHPEARAFFAGWNISSSFPTGIAASVHHAASEEKRISLSSKALYRGEWGQGSRQVANGRYVIVPSWDRGTTETGSSGAPLFNSRQQAIGQLRGGAATCSNGLFDAYGWLGASWEGGGAPDTRVKDWLNPRDSQLLEWNGKWAETCNAKLSASRNRLALCPDSSRSSALFVNTFFSGRVKLRQTQGQIFIKAALRDSVLAPGANTRVELRATPGAPPGLYPLVLEASDSLQTQTLTLWVELLQPPPGPEIPETLADTVFLNARPQLRWAPTPAVQNYRLEISAAENFAQILRSHALGPETRFELQNLPPGQYFWRVISINMCGEGISATAQFLLRTNNLSDLGDLQVTLDPNPTSGPLEMRFSKPADDLEVDVFSAQGQLLLRHTLPPQSTDFGLDLSAYPAGVYFIRLRYKQYRLVRRIVVQY